MFSICITFVLRFFLHMKKLLLTSVLLATVFVVLGSMDAFQRIEGINVAETNSNAMALEIAARCFIDGGRMPFVTGLK